MRAYWAVGVVVLMVAAVVGASYCGMNECRASDLHAWLFGDADKTMNVLTFVLVLIALWQIAEARAAGNQQAQDTLDALRISRESASAASESAVAAKHANELSLRMFAASNRPWVVVDMALGGGLIFDENGAAVTIIFTLRNVGKSPAAFVDVVSEFKLLGTPGFDMMQEQKRQLAELNTPPRLNSVHGFTLFPGDEHRIAMTYSTTRQNLEAGLMVPGQKPRFISPVFVGCANYRSLVSETRHQTGFILLLNRIELERPTNWLAIDWDAGNLPQGLLSLQRLPLGNYAT